MKKVIIVAMDFSEGAMGALLFAIRMANFIDTNIMMVWVDKNKLSTSVYSDANQPSVEAKKRFEEIVGKYSSSLPKGELLYKILDGKIQIELVNQAKYDDAICIVAGTHGASGFEEFLIGSNAYKIVANSEIPVITIRYSEEVTKPIKKILFPLDSTLESRQKAPFVAFLAAAFGAKIQILGVYTTKIENVRHLVDDYVNQIEKYFQDANIPHSVTKIEAENITRSVIEFAHEKNSDIIAIMTEQEYSPLNLFLGTYAQQMVNHSPFPVISIRPKSIYDYKTK